MKIEPTVAEVLTRSTFTDTRLVLPEQLDRTLYLRTAKVIVSLGGKWDRRAGAHIFPGEAGVLVAEALGTGEVRTAQEDGWFPTPASVVTHLVDLAGVRAAMTVLEPSAGEGAIAGACADLGAVVHCVELDPDRAAALRRLGFHHVHEGDFLELPPHPQFDRVVMNPPFAHGADVAHVTHALAYLKPGGRLVSVMAKGVTSRGDRRAVTFRRTITDAGGWFADLPEGAFKVSGTTVRTVVAVVPASKQNQS
jgi:predicted RNA methylase